MKRILIKLLNKIDLFKNRIFCIVKFKRFKVFGKLPEVRGNIKLFGHGECFFGENVVINSSLRSNPIGGAEKTIISISEGAKLEIGENTGISNTTIVCRKHIRVGKNVRIGGNTCIYDTDFHSLDLKKRISANDDDIKCREIVIADGAFIGAHCIILKGVTIGENSIVGAGSVVTKDIPDNEIWGGNPVKFIRKNEDSI